MSTAEIIAELPRLSAEDLAQVESRLREIIDQSRERTPSAAVQRPRIISPRLAHPEQSKDFRKQQHTPPT